MAQILFGVNSSVKIYYDGVEAGGIMTVPHVTSAQANVNQDIRPIYTIEKKFPVGLIRFAFISSGSITFSLENNGENVVSWLGIFSAAPTIGLEADDAYYDKTLHVFRRWSGTAWSTFVPDASNMGVLLPFYGKKIEIKGKIINEGGEEIGDGEISSDKCYLTQIQLGQTPQDVPQCSMSFTGYKPV